MFLFADLDPIIQSYKFMMNRILYSTHHDAHFVWLFLERLVLHDLIFPPCLTQVTDHKHNKACWGMLGILGLQCLTIRVGPCFHSHFHNAFPSLGHNTENECYYDTILSVLQFPHKTAGVHLDLFWLFSNMHSILLGRQFTGWLMRNYVTVQWEKDKNTILSFSTFYASSFRFHFDLFSMSMYNGYLSPFVVKVPVQKYLLNLWSSLSVYYVVLGS